MEVNREPMHVVLAGQSATGHGYPLLSLSDALRPAGHRVSFATTADLVQAMPTPAATTPH
ncbi:MAG TPA: hypothetical protein VE462_08695 [Propionibacteriaceae bacterium]|nr:hypothetical protein [Propionibacteriaceae bacterium]